MTSLSLKRKSSGKRADYGFKIIAVILFFIYLAYIGMAFLELQTHEFEQYKLMYPECFPDNPLETYALCDFFGGISTWFLIEHLAIIALIIGFLAVLDDE